MAHETCPYCSFVAENINSSVMQKILADHIRREHEQGWRRASSWGACKHCNGRGKDVYGITCKYCNGSGIA